MEQLKQRALNSKNQIKEKDAKLKEHTEKIPELQQTITNTEAEIETLNRDYDSSSKKVHGMRANVEETRNKQSAIRQGGRVQESLMKQKSTGAIPGIHGRLGDLGAIDKKYDVAVSTAAGGALDRILVDNGNTALACLKYLKDNDIGRVNMLALENTKK